MVIKVPYQEVIYIPKFYEVMKFAWVQYFATAIAFYMLLHYLFLNYVITGGAFDTVEVCEININKCR
jgi:hypothetical protein